MNATTSSFYPSGSPLDTPSLLLHLISAITLFQDILIAEVRAGKLGILVLLLRLALERYNAAKKPPATTQIIYVLQQELPPEVEKALRNQPKIDRRKKAKKDKDVGG
jgi:hypothetical protein